MGPRLKLPRYIHAFTDRHGQPRFYFRRAGFGSKPLRGLPYSPQFMADYEAASAGQPLSIGADRARPGTMAALALSYFASPQFRAMRLSSQKIYPASSSGFAGNTATSAWCCWGANTLCG
jgi:hypothetical protein